MRTFTRPILPTLLLAATALLLAGCDAELFDMFGNFWSLGICGTILLVLDVIALVEIAGSARSTGSKVLWALFIIFFPLLGLIVYYIFGR